MLVCLSLALAAAAVSHCHLGPSHHTCAVCQLSQTIDTPPDGRLVAAAPMPEAWVEAAEGMADVFEPLRDCRAPGDESLSPPTVQDSFAAFALETLEFERLSLQFGGRFEHNGYAPESGSEPPGRRGPSTAFPAPPACASLCGRGARSQPTPPAPAAPTLVGRVRRT